MKILNFGSCNIDYVYSMDHIVKAGETQTSYTLETFAGGKGLNQSVAAAKAGAKIYHAGYIGREGDFLKTLLFDNGVDVSFMNKCDTANGHAIIQVAKNGANSIFLYPGSNEMLSEEYIDGVLGAFCAKDVVVLQNEVNLVDYIIEKAYQKGMTIVLNPSPYNEKMKNIDFSKVSYLILNEIEAEDITGSKELETILAFFSDNYPHLVVILTLGGDGSVYLQNGERIVQPAYQVEVVDTTAAGDTFTGYIVAGIANQEAITDMMKKASAASSIACSQKGAAPSIPTCRQVMLSLKELKPCKNKKKNSELIAKIEEYTDSNISHANLESLASFLGYSVVYTGKLVKKLFCESFKVHLQKKRCEIAAAKLRNTDLSVEQIAESVGYQNKTFFRKIFKQRYGKNPLDYRRGD